MSKSEYIGYSIIIIGMIGMIVFYELFYGVTLFLPLFILSTVCTALGFLIVMGGDGK